MGGIKMYWRIILFPWNILVLGLNLRPLTAQSTTRVFSFSPTSSPERKTRLEAVTAPSRPFLMMFFTSTNLASLGFYPAAVWSQPSPGWTAARKLSKTEQLIKPVPEVNILTAGISLHSEAIKQSTKERENVLVIFEKVSVDEPAVVRNNPADPIRLNK